MMPGGSVIFDPAPVSWIKVVGKSPTHPLHPELSQAGELKQTLLFLQFFQISIRCGTARLDVTVFATPWIVFRKGIDIFLTPRGIWPL